MRGSLRPVALVVSVATLASCATLYPLDYYVLRDVPVSLGTNWTEIRCTEVITTRLPDKELWLLLPPPLDVPDYRERVVVRRRDGRRFEIEAQVVAADGEVYPLTVWLTRATIAGRPRAGTWMRLTSPELPQRLRLTAVRLRSSARVEVSEVLWTAGRTPGPPVHRPR